MRVLISPCAYKGSISASQVAYAIGDGLVPFGAQVQVMFAPIADGGDGTVESLEVALSLTSERLEVLGPQSLPVQAKWIYTNDMAVVELASASGIGYLNPDELNPFDTHTYGLGQVMKVALEKFPSKMFISVGGSASTDGGAGALCAVGARLLDADGIDIGPGNRALSRLRSCDLSRLSEMKSLQRCEMNVAADVQTVLLGANGAAAVYGPQKGATPDDIQILDDNLSHFADVLEAKTGRSCRHMAGAGAAGGTAFGIATVFGAKIISGFDWLSRLIDLEQKVGWADIVIGAEGYLDSQSLYGKAVGELAKLCLKFGKPFYVFPARADTETIWSEYGITLVAPTAINGQLATVASISKTAYRLLSML